MEYVEKYNGKEVEKNSLNLDREDGLKKSFSMVLRWVMRVCGPMKRKGEELNKNAEKKR